MRITYSICSRNRNYWTEQSGADFQNQSDYKDRIVDNSTYSSNSMNKIDWAQPHINEYMETHACIERRWIRIDRECTWIECQIYLLTTCNYWSTKLNKINQDTRRNDFDIDRCRWSQSRWGDHRYRQLEFVDTIGESLCRNEKLTERSNHRLTSLSLKRTHWGTISDRPCCDHRKWGSTVEHNIGTESEVLTSSKLYRCRQWWITRDECDAGWITTYNENTLKGYFLLYDKSSGRSRNFTGILRCGGASI
jgi:hypothetical protein